MREIFVVGLLIGCGRIDFDPRTDGGADGNDGGEIPRIGCVADIASNGQQACVRRDDGHVMCWGTNAQGNLGDSSGVIYRALPGPTPLFNAIAIASGDQTVCAISDLDELTCWGAGDLGQIGDGFVGDRPGPTQVTGVGGIAAAVAPAKFHTCARLTTGAGRCWGDNSAGQFGFVGAGSSVPVAAPVGDAMQLVTGDFLTCKLLASGTAQCWGSNTAGETGNGQLVDHATPEAVLVPDPIVDIAAGCHRHACAVTDRGDVWCWGENLDGQIGTGGFASPVATPVKVSGITGAVDVAVGIEFTCARTQTDEVWCWGINSSAQLGNGGTFGSPSPTRVTGLTGALARIEAGCANMYALRTNGTLVAWGDNATLGVVATNATSPVEVTVPCE